MKAIRNASFTILCIVYCCLSTKVSAEECLALATGCDGSSQGATADCNSQDCRDLCDWQCGESFVYAEPIGSCNAGTYTFTDPLGNDVYCSNGGCICSRELYPQG